MPKWSIPVKFQYYQDMDGKISELKHIPAYLDIGLGCSGFDRLIRNYSICNDKKSFKFTLEIPEYMRRVYA